MKRILFLACLLAATFSAQAQSAGSFVVRSGNTYTVEGQSLDKKGFMNYLQSHDQVVYQDFSKAYKLSNTGWGLFGAGLGMEVVGFGVMVGSAVQAGVDIATDQDLSHIKGVLVGELLFFIGGALDLSGIVCLGFGYGRMHKAADIYNVQVQQKYKAQLSFTGNGLALAW